MNNLREILSNYEFNDDVYCIKNFNKSQYTELNLRKKVAQKKYNNYFDKISLHHSIQIMDNELIKFLKKVPKNSNILDIGSGWCWIWRNIHKYRPDVRIFALDILFENFEVSKKILSKEAKKQVVFICENILNSKLPNNFFEAIWSVQTFQHIPEIKESFERTSKLLKNNGLFKHYNLHYNVFHKLKNLNKDKKKIWINHLFYLNRDISYQKKLLENIFKTKVTIEYSEFLYYPKINFFKIDLINKIQKALVGQNKILSMFARQVSFEIKK
tara:strand:- start:289 stop:1101 length:813 start_codon:yes stop_codon:yes gene_type:complete